MLFCFWHHSEGAGVNKFLSVLTGSCPWPAALAPKIISVLREVVMSPEQQETVIGKIKELRVQIAVHGLLFLVRV